LFTNTVKLSAIDSSGCLSPSFAPRCCVIDCITRTDLL